MTDRERQVIWRARYSTWGKVVFENKTIHAPEGFEQNLRMQGQYHDRETGLYYNTFRYYDADTGRFTMEDPIGLLGGINLYQYAPNPLGWIDPWGWSAGCGGGTKHKKISYDGVSRRDALRTAKRDAGIPNNQQPTVTREKIVENGQVVRKPDGTPVEGRVYHYTDKNGKSVAIQEHSLGHPDTQPQSGGKPHFNVRPPENMRTGSVDGTHGHYNF